MYVFPQTNAVLQTHRDLSVHQRPSVWSSFQPPVSFNTFFLFSLPMVIALEPWTVVEAS